jgi:hypothetical protein
LPCSRSGSAVKGGPAGPSEASREAAPLDGREAEAKSQPVIGWGGLVAGGAGVQSREDPFVGWESREAVRGLVDAALQAVVVALGSGGFDIEAVDAQRWGAEKALALRVVDVIDLVERQRGGHSGSLEQGGELIEESIVVGTAVEVEQFDCHVGGAERLLDRAHSEPGEDRSACESLRELGRLLEDHPGQVIADLFGGGAAFGQKGHGRAVQLGRHGREEHVLGAGAAMADDAT